MTDGLGTGVVAPRLIESGEGCMLHGTRRPRFFTVVLVGLLMAACAGPMPGPVREVDPNVINRPVWTIGDWWEFRDATGQWRLTVTGARGSGPSRYYIVERTTVRTPTDFSGNNETVTLGHVERQMALTNLRDTSHEAAEARHERIRFPLSIGAKWSYALPEEDHAVSDKLGSTSYRYEWVADGWETITVGGKPLPALKLSCLLRNRGEAVAHQSSWYSPEAKRVVRLTALRHSGGSKGSVAASPYEVTAWRVQEPPVLDHFMTPDPTLLVTMLQGKATVIGAGKASPVEIKRNDRVSPGDSLTTGRGARVKMIRGLTAVITVGEQSRLTLAGMDRRPSVTLDNGKISYWVPRQLTLPDVVHEIRTPNAVAAFRSTNVVVEIERRSAPFPPDSAVAVTHIDVVMEGTVLASVPGGPSIQLGQGQGVTIVGGILGPVRPANIGRAASGLQGKAGSPEKPEPD